MPSIANGFIATVVGSDAIYIANTFNGPTDGLQPSHRARIPSFLNIHVASSSISACGLDMRNAAYYRRSQIGSAQVEQKWYAHRVYYHTFVHEVKLLSGSDPVQVCLDANEGSPSDDMFFWDVNSPLPNVSIRVAQTLIPEMPLQPVNTVFVISTNYPRCSVLSPSSPLLRLFFVVHSSLSAGLVEYGATALQSSDQLFASHSAAWAQLWSSGVWVSDLQLARAINSSMFYILSSAHEALPFALSPGSLATNAYSGHVFWDQATWMLPPLAVFYPNITRELLQYRVDRIPEAQAKARSYQRGYRGAMFPWESAQSGLETCPSWASTGLLEQHISADVALAARLVHNLRRDARFLDDIACPLASQTAEFWVSRVEEGGGLYHISSIIPPDEYAENVTDSAYTNAAVSLALRWAYDACAGRPSVSGDPQRWLDVSSKLYVPYDSVHDLHPEYEGYTGQTTKQADVVLLNFPLGWPMSTQTKLNDLLYYANHTDSGGPAMTWGVFAISFLELDMPEQAAAFFARSYANSQQPFGVWRETPTGGATNFITGAGGFLQAVLFGYGGMRVGEKDIAMRVQLPLNNSRLTISAMRLYGCTITVDAEPSGVSVWSAAVCGVCARNQTSSVPVGPAPVRVAAIGDDWSLAEC